MNVNEAYERQTDLVRALREDDNPARAWFEFIIARSTKMAATGEPGNLVTLGDEDLMLRRHTDTGTIKASVVLDYQPHTDSSTEAAETVGVVDPDQVEASFAAAPDPDASEAIVYERAVFLRYVIDQMTNAPTFYVTRDMCDLLEYAASALDHTDVMPYHPAYPTGFVVLARPLRLPYGDGPSQVVHAFSWTDCGTVATNFGGTGHTGTVLQFADRIQGAEDPAVEAARNWFPSKAAWQQSPRLVTNISDRYTTGTPVGPPQESATGSAERHQALLAAIRGEAESVPPSGPATDGDSVGRFQPYLAAFLLLLTQEITAPRREHISDPSKKRARKVGRDADHVTVVDLRRRHHDDAGHDTGGESGQGRYHARHLVGGHWKWQPYGPQRALRRRIYVEGYIRGPEDKPLVVKPRVRRL